MPLSRPSRGTNPACSLQAPQGKLGASRSFVCGENVPFQQNFTDTRTGASFANGYQVITQMHVDMLNAVVTLTVSTYVSQAAFTAGKAAISVANYVCQGADYTTWFAQAVLIAQDKDPLTQAHGWLKTQADFANAVIVS